MMDARSGLFAERQGLLIEQGRTDPTIFGYMKIYHSEKRCWSLQLANAALSKSLVQIVVLLGSMIDASDGLVQWPCFLPLTSGKAQQLSYMMHFMIFPAQLLCSCSVS